MDNLTGQYILPVIVPLVVAILAMAFPLVQTQLRELVNTTNLRFWRGHSRKNAPIGVLCSF